jgi:hypothetical protein
MHSFSARTNYKRARCCSAGPTEADCGHIGLGGGKSEGHLDKVLSNATKDIITNNEV